MEEQPSDEYGPQVDLDAPEFDSPEYQELRDRVKRNQSSLPDMTVCDGYVYIRTQPRTGDPIQEDEAWKLWIPRGLVPDVLKRAHDPPQASHGGIGKTLERVRRHLYWPRMTIDVRAYVLACETCKETKAPNSILRPPMGAQTKTERPWQRLYLDLLGPYPRSKRGNICILIALDHFSKYPLLKPLKKASTSLIVDYVEEEIFHKFGVPETLVTDNGSQFRSAQFGRLLEKYGIHHLRTAPYSPQANASERVNRSILSGIRAYIQDSHDRWDEKLSSIASSLRSSIHQSIGCSPYKVLFGLQMVEHASTYALLRGLQSIEEPIYVDSSDKLRILRSQTQQNLDKAFERGAKLYNLRAKEVEFKIGQEVFRRNFQQSSFEKHTNAKLNKKFLKCRVKARKGNCLYELEDLHGNLIGVYHAKDIRP